MTVGSGSPPGNQLGPYELGERLGNGGMAEVYIGHRAGPRGFQKRFAIKRILPQLAVDDRFVGMFCDEARICAALSHRNIVEVVDFGEQRGELFMAMEYVDGVSLARLLRFVAARGQRFPLGAALTIAAEVLAGLRYAHEARDEQGRPLNIVHRDVSPGNILIGRAGEVKLTDFGIVLSAFVDRRTYPGELKGKMGYMSPEQVIGQDLDLRSDLFTLGIVLTEMLLARPLFPGKSELDMLTRMYEADLQVLERHGGELPAGLVSILRTALARDRERRFQSARDFADALRGLAGTLGVTLEDGVLASWVSALGILADPVSAVPEAAHRTPSELALAVARDSVGERAPLRAREAVAAPQPQRRPTPPQSNAARLPAELLVMRGDGEMLETLSIPEVLARIATGALATSAVGAVRGGEFAPLAEIPGIGALAERPAFRFDERRGSGATFRRSLDRRTLPGVLLGLARTGGSGLLVARCGERQKRIYFEAGLPHFVASTERAELFGAWLIGAGLIEAEQVESALMMAAERGQRLGEMLVAIGRLRPTALLRALSQQIASRYVELGRWGEGELAFFRGELSVEDRVNVEGSALSLAAAALHRGYDDAEIAALLEGSRADPIARLLTDVDAAELGLTGAQRRALELAPGAASLRELIGDLARDAAVRPEDTRRGVFAGLASGLLVMPGWPLTSL